ncbi:hypothetical protein PR202_gb15579 [Eleusine coracana subsp. coracana]|uniref:Uncharacterized protein n=1 Tax=Eleusine coracana subsp. coracana TaxID=191504 RepID=A0AAV5EW04_ELECO|nr:hypothetical protein PR202_gb15579 [Eleusine coracana subsp. coracana]
MPSSTPSCRSSRLDRPCSCACCRGAGWGCGAPCHASTSTIESSKMKNRTGRRIAFGVLVRPKDPVGLRILSTAC